MDKRIISKQYTAIKTGRKVDDNYIDRRKTEYEEIKNKNTEDNSTIKEYKCIYCGSNKVKIAYNSKYMGSKTDIDAKMIKFYCNRCNCHFYLLWEDLL